jgi:hypothetical protein
MNITRLVLAAGVGLALAAGPAAFAASDHHDTAKGAAVGAVAGHEMGHGHALAGAGVGAAIGHHEGKKAERKNG